MKDTHIVLSDFFNNIFLDLQLDFKKMNSTKQDIFQKRNAFCFVGYSNFVESSIIAAVEYGGIIGDIRFQNGRWVIDVDNLKKKTINKPIITLPREWNTVNDWRNKIIKLK